MSKLGVVSEGAHRLLKIDEQIKIKTILPAFIYIYIKQLTHYDEIGWA